LLLHQDKHYFPPQKAKPCRLADLITPVAASSALAVALHRSLQHCDSCLESTASSTIARLHSKSQGLAPTEKG
jgi:hypothetical protein